MSYRRIEVNLLPPELQPGPAIRSALIINITLILGTAFAILLTAALSIYRYAQYETDIEKTTQSIANLASVKEGYQQLQKIDAAVHNYGAIVGIATTDYIDLPVLLSHLSNILPDEVYLVNVSNTRAGNTTAYSVLDPNRATFISMTLRSSRKDLGLILRTLERLKQDEVFANCVLTNAELDSEDLLDLSEALGMEIMFDLPSSADVPQEYNFYEFVIRAEVTRPLVDTGSRVLDDQLELFKASKPIPDAASAAAAAAAQAAGAAGQPPASGETPGVVGGPEGVTGTSNRGGN